MEVLKSDGLRGKLARTERKIKRVKECVFLGSQTEVRSRLSDERLGNGRT